MTKEIQKLSDDLDDLDNEIFLMQMHIENLQGRSENLRDRIREIKKGKKK